MDAPLGQELHHTNKSKFEGNKTHLLTHSRARWISSDIESSAESIIRYVK